MTLVLSIFPGLGLLDRAFEAEGFCVVRGPDPIWGGTVREFHPPAGTFDGVIGGDPCQSHSALANLVRAKGLAPTFPDLTPEYERIIREAQPRWFLRENVPHAPDLKIDGYAVHSFLLCNSWLDAGEGLGEQQMRKRRFWFGRRGTLSYDLRRNLEVAALEMPSARAVCGDARSVPVALGGSGKLKRSAVTGRHAGEIGTTGGHRGSPGRYTVAQMLELQGLPPDFLDHCPLTESGKRQGVGNGVPRAMGIALARAIKRFYQIAESGCDLLPEPKGEA